MLGKTLAIIWKDALLRFSSRSELLFFIILPVIFTFILSGSFASAGDGDGRVLLPVVDADASAESAAFIDQLSQSATVRPELATVAESQELVDEGEISGVLTIPAGFGAALVAANMADASAAPLALAIDPADNYGLIIEQAVQTAVNELTGPLQVASGAVQGIQGVTPFASAEERGAFFEAAREQGTATLLAAATQVRQTVAAAQDTFEYDAAAQASAGQLITWVLIPLLGTAALMAYERTSGTLRRLLVTPSRKPTFLLGTMSGQVLMSMVQMALLIGFGVLVLGVSWGTSPVALLMVLVSFSLAGVAMGTMLGAFTQTASQASSISIIMGMLMALLGGCWWPMELFPQGLQSVVKALPTTWAMQGLTDIVLRGQGAADVMLETGVLLGFALLFFVVGVWRFRFE